MIEVQTTRVESLFESILEIPLYQRRYVWKADQVRALVDDIFDHWTDKSRGDLFIGPIVLSPHDRHETRYILVDGQQRITTLFLMLCEVYNRYIELAQGNHDGDVLAEYQRRLVCLEGEGRLTCRLKNEDEHLDTILAEMLPATLSVRCHLPVTPKGPHTKGPRRSLRSARDVIRGALKQIHNTGDLFKFNSHLLRSVQMLPYKADIETSLRVFESLNARGIPLSSADLIKNFVLKSVPAQSRDAIADEWQQLLDLIEDEVPQGSCIENKKTASGDPQTFLRYYLIGKHGLESLQKNKLHLELPKLENLQEGSTYLWLQGLSGAARCYIGFVHGLVDGEECASLRRLQDHFPRQKQHLAPILSAAVHGLSPEALRKIASVCESIVVASSFIGENSTKNEHRFLPLAAQVKGMSETDFLQHLIEWHGKEMAGLRPALRGVLAGWSPDETRAKYILSLCEEALGEQPASMRGVRVEQVLDPDDEDLVINFDGDLESSYERLGNRYLIQRGENPLREQKFEISQEQFFSRSQFMTTKCIGTSVGVDKRLQGIAVRNQWKEGQISAREEVLIDLVNQQLDWGLT